MDYNTYILEDLRGMGIASYADTDQDDDPNMLRVGDKVRVKTIDELKEYTKKKKIKFNEHARHIDVVFTEGSMSFTALMLPMCGLETEIESVRGENRFVKYKTFGIKGSTHAWLPQWLHTMK